MNNFFRSRFFIVLLLIAMLLCILPTTLAVMGHGGYVRGAVVTVMYPFQRLAGIVGESLSGYSQYFSRFDELKEENEQLKAELAALKEQSYEAELHKSENEWLREYLELKKIKHTFSLADAKVVGRETTNTRTVYTLDRGSSAGVGKNMPVITSDGVVGYIIEVGLTWSKAVAITDDRSNVGVYTDRTGATGVLCGTYTLSFEGKCDLTCTAADADIQVGDRIITSGLGTTYPEGLSVGVVSEVYRDEYDRSLHAIVTPHVDFDEVSAVMIVCGFSVESGE